ncbi:DnaB-like helicase C-terminal domain-containing protein [Sulfobacillus harzensis]|uniref:AAA family ATPase n=1 Tax=Sulfobacillus harzensis TaxID=2729629 RepID=A0A7Y0L691_9FIRM|nr:DnaB-like helicase C-terminal domain-containing protein [Sulfobacillus harzensis]NMP23803.1 AAA family ATPase [Sulfobacillus harzensis]
MADDNRDLVENAVVLLALTHVDRPLEAPVQETWFQNGLARRAWQHVAQWRQAGTAADLASLVGVLGPDWGSVAEQYPLIAETFSLRTAVEALRQYAVRDQLQTWLRELPRRWDDPLGAAGWVATQAAQLLGAHQPVTAHTGAAMATAHWTLTEERMAHPEATGGLTFGLPHLDALVQGLGPGDVVFLGGRPKTGKTTFVLNWVRHWLKTGHGVVLFSFEMVWDEIAARLIAMESGLPTKAVEKGLLADDEWGRYRDANGWLSAQPIHVYDTPLTWPDIAARIRQHVARGEAGVVVIDHLGLISRPGRQNSNEELAQIVQPAKNLAQELRIPVVVISQLSRAVEARQDKRPQPYDFRDSGTIEQTANLALMLWQPLPMDLGGFYGRMAPDVMPIECYVAAYRSGPSRVGLLVDWDRNTGRMQDGGESPYDPTQKREGM